MFTSETTTAHAESEHEGAGAIEAVAPARGDGGVGDAPPAPPADAEWTPAPEMAPEHVVADLAARAAGALVGGGVAAVEAVALAKRQEALAAVEHHEAQTEQAAVEHKE